jgi:hypothetical protein
MSYDLKGFSVTQLGQQINVKGDVYDQVTGQKINSFGPTGINFVTWFQQLPVQAQMELVRDRLSPFMVQWLLGTWPSADGGIG